MSDPHRDVKPGRGAHVAGSLQHTQEATDGICKLGLRGVDSSVRQDLDFSEIQATTEER